MSFLLNEFTLGAWAAASQLNWLSLWHTQARQGNLSQKQLNCEKPLQKFIIRRIGHSRRQSPTGGWADGAATVGCRRGMREMRLWHVEHLWATACHEGSSLVVVVVVFVLLFVVVAAVVVFCAQLAMWPGALHFGRFIVENILCCLLKCRQQGKNQANPFWLQPTPLQAALPSRSITKANKKGSQRQRAKQIPVVALGAASTSSSTTLLPGSLLPFSRMIASRRNPFCCNGCLCPAATAPPLAQVLAAPL